MDKRALKILFDTYWSSNGWVRGERRLGADDFAYAKSRRVMFDPIRPTHEEAISRLHSVIHRLEPRQVADGFLASLSTRQLDWRSALGSYSACRWLPVHEPTLGHSICAICGLSDYTHVAEHDLNVLNFERLKWGGIRHTDPIYATLDLELFLEAPPATPRAEDIHLFHQLLSAIATAPATVTSATLHKHFSASLKANQAERNQLIAILGLSGILGTAEHPGFGERFIPVHQRSLPGRHFVDMAYPACWWRGSDGINNDRLQEVFGHVLSRVI